MRLIDADTIFNNELLLVRTECYDAVHAVIERINNAPTVDPVKHGHWVMSNGDYEWECSSCGCGLTDNRTSYCHDCGAKMDEVEDGLEGE